jgi:zinc finger protein CreA/MIG
LLSSLLKPSLLLTSQSLFRQEDERTPGPSRLNHDQKPYGGFGGPGGGAAGDGSSESMNEMSALAAAASDQLFELERSESVRRAEYEMRHRQIIGQSGRNSGAAGSALMGGNAGGFGYDERGDRWAGNSAAAGNGNAGLGGGNGGSDFHAPGQAVHHAVGAGNLTDLTYLTPPNCHHSECHKSYRKRLRAAQRALSLQATGGAGGFGTGLGGNLSAGSSASNLAGQNFFGANGNLSAALGINGQLTPQQAQQLQQMQIAQQQQQQRGQQGFRSHRGSLAYGLGGNPDNSVGPSPASSVSSDELEDQAMLPIGQANINPAANSLGGANSNDYSFAGATSPDIGSMRNMSIFPPLGGTNNGALNMSAYAASLGNLSVASTAPTSGVNSPVTSRINSRSGSPVHFDMDPRLEGHGVGNKLHHQHQKHRCVVALSSVPTAPLPD